MPAGSTRLGRKLLGSLAATLAIASLAFLILLIGIYRDRLTHERASASAQVNQLLQVALENAMLKRDLEGLGDIIERLGSQPGIIAVHVVDTDRHIRFSSNGADRDRRLGAADIACPECGDGNGLPQRAGTRVIESASGADVIRSINPIANREPCQECHGKTADRPVNGVLIVDHDASAIRRDSLKAAGALSVAGLVVVLLGLLGHWAMLRRTVVAPIAALDEASRALAAGDLSRRVVARRARPDEISELSASFNAMADRIDESVSALRGQQAFMKAIMDTVPDGLRVLDEDKRVVLANASLERQLSTRVEDMIGRPCHLAHGLDAPCAPTLVTCPFHAIEKDDEPIRYVHRHVAADGREIHVETTAARFTVTDGGRKRVLIVEAIRDLEDQIKYSHEQRLSEIGQLAAGVAHEIYNPLASVRIGLQAVLRQANERGADPETKEYLGMVEGEVEKCIAVARRLLDLSQVPSTDVQLVSATAIIPEVASLLRYEAEQRRISIVLNLGTEDLRILATDAELRMLTLNIMQNAFHAMPDGGILRVTGRQDEREVALSFADTGVGIEPDKLPRIFDAFYSRRADGVTGTGLGLTICRAIVARHGGDIAVQSTRGSGSTFTVTLPRPAARLESV